MSNQIQNQNQSRSELLALIDFYDWADAQNLEGTKVATALLIEKEWARVNQ